MVKVAILQSNYIPWKGYFDLINLVDTFILYDDVQYTRRDWRNRNKIKIPDGTTWLTIPVQTKGKYLQSIKETKVDGHEWIDKHWKAITLSYGKAPYFKNVAPFIKELYEQCRDEEYLSRINYLFITSICRMLEIRTEIVFSLEYKITEGRSERLLDLCKQTGASEYVSGPAAKEYLDVNLFKEKGITVKWMDYNGYIEYPQVFSPFIHEVSILDLLFCVGTVEAKTYMLSFNGKIL